MKKTLLFAFISLPWFTLSAQSFYIKPYGGFGAGIHGTLFNLSYQVITRTRIQIILHIVTSQQRCLSGMEQSSD